MQVPTSVDISAADIAPDGIGWWDWASAGIIFIAGVAIAIGASRLAQRALHATDRGAAAKLVGRLISGLLIAIAAVYALSSINVRIGPLLGVIGVGGIALAFALQDILENFIAGILLQLRTRFWIGDQIRTNDVEGTVEDIDLRAVVIRTFDGRLVVVPSAMVLKNVIDNDTAFQSRRSEIPVGVSYSASIPEARRLMVEAAATSDHVLEHPPPVAYVTELGASAIVFSLHIWHLPQRAERWKVIDDVIERVKRALDEAGINIPFDQLTVRFPDGIRVHRGDEDPA